MKTFLRAWLAEAPEFLTRKLAGDIELRPSAQLPRPETATTLAVSLGGPYAGCLLVTADRYALQALLAGARITDGSVDADRDRELWRGMLEQIAAAAVHRFDPAQEAGIPIHVEDGEWTLGLASAAYELRFGEVVVLLAFTDQVHVSEPAVSDPAASQDAPASMPENGHEPEVSGSAAVSEAGANTGAKVTPRGVDLLLDVELETSLRFGSREMPLSAVLDLGAGDVVELDRHVSDPVDLLVGDKIVARGEVVLVNGTFGLRILEVAEPKKCLESIRCLF
jgi:flagellar motor switch protein FliN